MMEYYELTIPVYLLYDIHYTKVPELLSQIINKAMFLDKDLSEKHEKNEYKFYVFDNLYPLEEDKKYKKGRIYVFRIRSLDSLFAERIKNLILKVKNEWLKIVSIELKKKKKRHIVDLYTVTPALITIDNRYWLPGDNFTLLQERFQASLEKKYKSFYGEKLEVKNSFIQYIEILNKKSMSFAYKNTRLLGSKFKIIINEDEISQRLAFVAEAAGLGEKSSTIGMGFCNAHYLK